MSENELKHYGVLGMKWGVRRARKNGTTYQYKSHRQKKWEKKLDKAVSKGTDEYKISRASTKLNTYKKRDANRQLYAEHTKVGSAVVRGLLMTPWGNGNYSRLRASGASKGVSALLSLVMPLPIGHIMSRGFEADSAKR